MPTHESATRWSTGGSYVIVRQPYRVPVQGIEGGGLDDGVAMSRDVSVALVIGNDQYHIGGVRRGHGSEEGGLNRD